MRDEPATDDAWLAERLTSDPQLWELLGCTGADLRDIKVAVAELLADSSESGQHTRDRVIAATHRLRETIADFTFHQGVFGDQYDEAWPSAVPGRGLGVAAAVALAAATSEVREFHRQRGISDAISWATLADLGQQMRVHRQTFGEFGLHTQGWLVCAWSGALYALGRLQFNLNWYQPSAAEQPDDPRHESRWVLSAHIPATGPLAPVAVDESLAHAKAFFAAHFPDYPVDEFYCSSWLLDPRMALLDPQSNLAQFQARWQLVGPGVPANPDAIFFLWHRRGEVDTTELPTDSSLRRLVATEMTNDRAWRCVQGLLKL